MQQELGSIDDSKQQTLNNHVPVKVITHACACLI